MGDSSQNENPLPSSTGPGTPFSGASHARAEIEVWGDAWLRNKLQGSATQPKDVTRIAEYMQDILSSRNKLALDQKAKIQELEEQCVKYAHDIGLLKSVVADVEDKSARDQQSMAAEIESLVKELQWKDLPQTYHTHVHGAIKFSSTKSSSELDIGSLQRLPLTAQIQACKKREDAFAEQRFACMNSKVPSELTMRNFPVAA